MNANRRRRPPIYNPTLSNLVALPDQWLDASDTTTIDKAGPLPITNGATVFEWRDKSATARQYQLLGSGNVAPIWESNVVGSLGAVKFVYDVPTNKGNILSCLNLTGMRGLTGRTTICAARMGTYQAGQTYFIFTVTESHRFTAASGAQFTCDIVDTFRSVTCRQQGDTQSINAPFASDDIHGVAIANGQTIVTTTALDLTAGTNFCYANGTLPRQFHSAATNTGTTDPSNDPFAMSVGAVAQELPSAGFGNGYMDGYIFEILDWFQYLTPEQLIGPHYYLRRKWGKGLL